MMDTNELLQLQKKVMNDIMVLSKEEAEEVLKEVQKHEVQAHKARDDEARRN